MQKDRDDKRSQIQKQREEGKMKYNMFYQSKIGSVKNDSSNKAEISKQNI